MERPTRLSLGGLEAQVRWKDIKNVHLSVHPPTGRVTLSAPRHMGLETLRAFAIAKLPWIRKQQAALHGQPREEPRDFIERESHFVWGARYLLQLIEVDAAPSVHLDGKRLELCVRPGTLVEDRAEILHAWYRRELREAAQPMIERLEKKMGVRVARVHVQHMRTRWGGCNPAKGSIRLNTELAKKPPACLEYLLVHEMAHLLEPTHNERFRILMDRFLPAWEERRNLLNSLPVRHEAWEY